VLLVPGGGGGAGDGEESSMSDELDDRPRAARDVPPGKPWAFLEHQTMAEVVREEGTWVDAPKGNSGVVIPLLRRVRSLLGLA